MKHSLKLPLVGLMLSALAILALAPHATGEIRYGYAISLSLADGSQTMMLERPGQYHETLVLVLWPLWSVNGDTYDTVTLTFTLQRYRTVDGWSTPTLLAENCVFLQYDVQQCKWTNVHLSQDEDGATVGAALYFAMDITVNERDGIGTYSLVYDAIATAPGLVHEGHGYLPLWVHA